MFQSKKDYLRCSFEFPYKPLNFPPSCPDYPRCNLCHELLYLESGHPKYFHKALVHLPRRILKEPSTVFASIA